MSAAAAGAAGTSGVQQDMRCLPRWVMQGWLHAEVLSNSSPAVGAIFASLIEQM
jgi:hypothetical protein